MWTNRFGMMTNCFSKDRNDTSLIINTTTDQIENGEEEIEKPDQEEGNQSKGSSAVVGEADGLS